MRAKVIDLGEVDLFYNYKDMYIGLTGEFKPDSVESYLPFRSGRFNFDNGESTYFVAISIEELPEIPIAWVPMISDTELMPDLKSPPIKIALSEGTKHDDGKLRLDLIPPEVELVLGEILTYGAKKYEDRNWEKGIKYNRVYGALRRHLLAWLQGEKLDSESNKPHLWHALCCLSFLVTYEERGMATTFDNLHHNLKEDNHE